MTTDFIFAFAIGVFVLMCIGITLTMLEFTRLTDEPSVRKGSGQEAPARDPDLQLQ